MLQACDMSTCPTHHAQAALLVHATTGPVCRAGPRRATQEAPQARGRRPDIVRLQGGESTHAAGAQATRQSSDLAYTRRPVLERACDVSGLQHEHTLHLADLPL
jgi:hypothetical protein